MRESLFLEETNLSSSIKAHSFSYLSILYFFVIVSISIPNFRQRPMHPLFFQSKGRGSSFEIYLETIEGTGIRGFRMFFEVFWKSIGNKRSDLWRTKARNAPLTHTLVLLPFLLSSGHLFLLFFSIKKKRKARKYVRSSPWGRPSPIMEAANKFTR